MILIHLYPAPVGEEHRIFPSIGDLERGMNLDLPLSMEDQALIEGRSRMGLYTFAAVDPFLEDVHKERGLMLDSNIERLKARHLEAHDNI